MTARNPRVLIVSRDRGLLRQLSQFLELFGYPSVQAAATEEAMRAWQAHEPDTVIIDGELPTRAMLELCQRLRGERPDGDLYLMCCIGEDDADNLVQVAEAGVDDFLAKPVVHGELLSRLRAASRYTAARHHQTAPRDRLTGLLTTDALLRQWRNRKALHQSAATPSSCVVAGVDSLERINRLWGYAAGDAVLVWLAELCVRHAGPDALVGRLDGDQLAIVLPTSAPDDARHRAESMREEIARHSVDWADQALDVTASFGIAAHHAEDEAARTLAAARRALVAAKQSGRNLTLIDGETEDSDSSLRELAGPGSLFAGTRARDVMLPCSLLLRPNDSTHHAAALLRRCGLSAAPVVDRSGQLLGLADAAKLTSERPSAHAADNGKTTEVADVLQREVTCFELDTPFAKLFDFFVADTAADAVVVDGRRPLGLLSREGLTALIEPATDHAESARGTAATGA